MADTLDSVPGHWTVWIRTTDQSTTAAYTASFAALASTTAEGTVTLTGPSGTTFNGTWQEKQGALEENVSLEIQNFPTPDDSTTFSGHMVGLAMAGRIGPIIPRTGAWAAYKIAD